MEIVILCIGKIKEEFYRRQIAALNSKLNTGRYACSIVEFPDERIPERLSEKKKEAFLEKECERLFQQFTPRDYVIALCVEGKELTSAQHKGIFRKAEQDGYERIIYVIGGSLGLPEKVKKRADKKMSFSKMTFPHQIMRMVLCEELVGILF